MQPDAEDCQDEVRRRQSHRSRTSLGAPAQGAAFPFACNPVAYARFGLIRKKQGMRYHDLLLGVIGGFVAEFDNNTHVLLRVTNLAGAEVCLCSSSIHVTGPSIEYPGAWALKGDSAAGLRHWYEALKSASCGDHRGAACVWPAPPVDGDGDGPAAARPTADDVPSPFFEEYCHFGPVKFVRKAKAQRMFLGVVANFVAEFDPATLALLRVTNLSGATLIPLRRLLCVRGATTSANWKWEWTLDATGEWEEVLYYASGLGGWGSPGPVPGPGPLQSHVARTRDPNSSQECKDEEADCTSPGLRWSAWPKPSGPLSKSPSVAQSPSPSSSPSPSPERRGSSLSLSAALVEERRGQMRMLRRLTTSAKHRLSLT